MIKIAFICSSLARTGPTSQLLNITYGMQKRDCDVKVIVLSRRTDAGMYAEFQKKGIEIEFLDASKYNIMRLLLLLRISLQNFKPDFIHSQGIRADLMQLLIGKKFQKLTTLRNEPYTDYTDRYGPFIGWLAAYLHFCLLKHMDKVVCVSDSVRNSALNIAPNLDTLTIRNGVDFEKFTPRRNVGSNTEHDRNPIKFIFTGPLIGRKNVLHLIDVWRCLGGSSTLDIVGQNHANLKQPELPSNIFIHGHQNNIQNYLEECDCFISLSLSEGFPNAVLEALAVGLPCILSDIDAHAEIYAKVPEFVVLVPQNCDCEALSEAIEQISNILARFEHTEISDFARSQFDVEVMCVNYKDLYKL